MDRGGRFEVSKYLEFEECEYAGKTQVFAVLSKKHGDILGKVRWYGPWRQYVFYPETGTLFNPTCLNEISWFVADLTRRYKS